MDDWIGVSDFFPQEKGPRWEVEQLQELERERLHLQEMTGRAEDLHSRHMLETQIVRLMFSETEDRRVVCYVVVPGVLQCCARPIQAVLLPHLAIYIATHQSSVPASRCSA